MTAENIEEQEDTILEYTVREKLTKDQLVDLLASLGGQKQGKTEELAERLLAIKGLKSKDALSKLSTDDLKVIVRRFDIPEPPKPSGLLGLASSVLSDDRATLMKRIEDVASKQRAPIPRGKAQPAAPETKPPGPAPPKVVVAPPEPPRVPEAAPPPPAPERPLEASRAPPAAPASAGAPASMPAFQETRDFVGSYKFAYQWSEEDYYEAELLGALRGRFGSNNAVRQQGESGGRVYDIVVRNSARVEVKLPKSKAELDRMIGQVRRYLTQHPGGMIVVIVGHAMKNQQDIHNAQEELESAGAVVFQK
jgi:hypothetical protein